VKLLANNFNDKRWKATALKNAYALLSKRRFQYAAAFFLLGDGAWDAVNVCVHQLRDIQLAVAIARVYDPTGTVLARLVDETILGRAVESHQGRWMASWALSSLGRREAAVRVLVRPVHEVVGLSLDKVEQKDMVGSQSYAANDPLVTCLYTQLRAELVKQDKWNRDKVVVSAHEEWSLVVRTVRQYLRMGCDVLALGLVKDWEFVADTRPPAAAQKQRPTPTIHRRTTFFDLEKEEDDEVKSRAPVPPPTEDKPAPTQFEEPSANSLLDSFGF